MYIVSACLLGENCKYNGGNNDNEAVKRFIDGEKYIAVCPETAGGLRPPREPAEQIIESDGSIRVLDRTGSDLTENFRCGAEICMNKVLTAIEIDSKERGGDTRPHGRDTIAILKANSPSCGSCVIYDGTFTGTLTEGDGLFAKLVKEHGIKVLTEKDIEHDIEDPKEKE